MIAVPEMRELVVKVLVTGATGFVGRHVVARLIERGHAVVAVARDEARARAQDWFHAVRFVACDIQLLSDDPALQGDPVDAVIHLAWPGLPNYGSPFHFEEKLPAAYRFLKTLVESGVGHVLVTGTCFEYGMQNGPLAETRRRSRPTRTRWPRIRSANFFSRCNRVVRSHYNGRGCSTCTARASIRTAYWRNSIAPSTIGNRVQHVGRRAIA